MIYILHYLKGPKLWELWYNPNYGYCRIYLINRSCNEPCHCLPGAFYAWTPHRLRLRGLWSLGETPESYC